MWYNSVFFKLFWAQLTENIVFYYMTWQKHNGDMNITKIFISCWLVCTLLLHLLLFSFICSFILLKCWCWTNEFISWTPIQQNTQLDKHFPRKHNRLHKCRTTIVRSANPAAGASHTGRVMGVSAGVFNCPLLPTSALAQHVHMSKKVLH